MRNGNARTRGWTRAWGAGAAAILALAWCAEARGQWGGGRVRPAGFSVGGTTGGAAAPARTALARAEKPASSAMAKPEKGKFRDVAYDLPTLAVRGQNEGLCRRSKFRVTWSGGDGALRIVTSDDTPGGSGRASRASLWQAAMTAAMLRGNPLTGARIEYEYMGLVDGPSAGSVYCLAILSAMDGRDFPKDFAMTGTIMPDGTIGLVGGVAYKLKGAKAAGIRRVCIPAFARFETESDGSLVDLVDEARELGLELHLVSNVEEAYAILHGLPAPAAVRISDAEAYAEPLEQEKALFAAIQRNAQEAEEAKERVARRLRDDDEQELMAAVIKLMLERYDMPDWAVPLKAGMLHIAFQRSAEELAFWQGVFRLAERVGRILGEYDLETVDGYRRWDGDVQKNFDRVASGVASLEGDWLKDASAGGAGGALKAQCVSVNWFSEIRNFKARSRGELPTQEDIDRDEAAEFLASALMQEVLCARWEKYVENADLGWRILAKTLPRRAPERSAREVEGLFFAAQMALAEAMDEEYGTASMGLAVRNFDWSLYLMKKQEAVQYHQDALELESRGDGAVEFAMVMSAMAQADALAHGFMAKTMASNEIGFSVDEEDGSWSYSNHPFLSYLLRTSRAQAVRALAECAKQGIPCPRVRCHVESGDYHRDDDSYDRFDVLREYWCAMLKAKLLDMLF